MEQGMSEKKIQTGKAKYPPNTPNMANLEQLAHPERYRWLSRVKLAEGGGRDVVQRRRVSLGQDLRRGEREATKVPLGVNSLKSIFNFSA